MDKPRVGCARKQRIRQIALASSAAVVVGVLGWAVSRLEPAAPSVNSAVVFTDSVKRGEMLRQVRGIGTLVPETIVVIAASDAGRVELRHVQPGQDVRPSTALLELSSPQVEQEYLDAEAQLKGPKLTWRTSKPSLRTRGSTKTPLPLSLRASICNRKRSTTRTSSWQVRA